MFVIVKPEVALSNLPDKQWTIVNLQYAYCLVNFIAGVIKIIDYMSPLIKHADVVFPFPKKDQNHGALNSLLVCSKLYFLVFLHENYLK